MKPLYGNWISNRMLKTLMFLIILTGGIETILLISQSRWTMLNLILALVLIVFLVCLIYFTVPDGGLMSTEVISRTRF